MTSWLNGFTIGIAVGLTAPLIVAALVRFAHYVWRSKPERKAWKIDGVRYTGRPVTRQVMEQLTAIHADVPEPAMVMPLASMFGGEEPDEDKAREQRVRFHSSRLEVTFKTAALLLQDENGESPPEELLNEHLTVEEASDICQALL